MKKLVPILILAFLVSSMFLVTVQPSNATVPVSDPIAIDMANAPKMPVVNLEGILDQTDHHSPWALGAVAYWLIYTTTGYGLARFTLRAIGPNTEIWVQNNLAWPANDVRPTPIILDTEIAYLLAQFENNIYPTDTHYFGDPVARDGSTALLPSLAGLPADYYAEGNTKNVILVENVRDTFYYSNNTYPYYIAGFFTSSFDVYFDRNVISINSYQWERRLGPYGTVWIPPTIVTRPFVYESTIAHEYQHLIHNDWNPGDDTFMNEGCAMYAEYLCGYGIDVSYLNSYFYTPDNSLTIWGDQGDINILADYGVAALWVMYLNDHYGGAATISYFVDNGVPGIDGVNVALAHFGYSATFDTVFHDWRLANLLRQTSGPYSYTSINLSDPSIIPIYTHNVNGFPVPWTSASTSFGNTLTILGYDTGVSKIYGYGSDYLTFTNWSKPGFIGFDGDDIASVPGWTMTAGAWWSGTGVDLQDASIVGTATVSAANPTLTIVTKYSIESNWDFGFVQVSTDNGATWTSLSNAYTTSVHDPQAHPAIIAQLPGLTGDDSTADNDPSPGWPNFMTMSFDLTAYAGMTVQIRFRYMTDWSTTYEGWWINSATVGGTALTLAPVYPKASYQVTAIKVVVTAKKIAYTLPVDFALAANTQTGEWATYAMNPTYIVLIVSPTMRAGTVDYQFRAYSKAAK